MLVLSATASDEERAALIGQVESQISNGGGRVERRDDWGSRPLTFRIRHETEAHYHLLQFSGPTTLLDALSHSLRIDDKVLRFRIIKVLSGTPPPPDSPPPVIAAVASHGAHGASADAAVGAGVGAASGAGSGSGSEE
jgi:small subunit ribosomal protein S6